MTPLSHFLASASLARPKSRARARAARGLREFARLQHAGSAWTPHSRTGPPARVGGRQACVVPRPPQVERFHAKGASASCLGLGGRAQGKVLTLILARILPTRLKTCASMRCGPVRRCAACNEIVHTRLLHKCALGRVRWGAARLVVRSSRPTAPTKRIHAGDSRLARCGHGRRES